VQSYDNALKRHEEFETARNAALADLYKERDVLNGKIRQLESYGKKPTEKKRGRPPKETKKGTE
jgi:hypothetical protein